MLSIVISALQLRAIAAIFILLCLPEVVLAEKKISSQWKASPTADERGYVDVWRLRADVAHVEARYARDDTDSCSSGEGDPDEHLGRKEIRRRQRAEIICIKKVAKAYKAYQKVFAAFNHAWTPVLQQAVYKGDPVAEVILRQCATTEVLDRSYIESTCDSVPERSAVAVQRLNQIGFLPATIDFLPMSRFRASSSEANETEFNQLSDLKKIRGGAINFDRILDDPGGSVARTPAHLEAHRRWDLIQAIQHEAPRAFTISPTFPELRLVRKPSTPGVLTRGPEIGDGYEDHHWRRGSRVVFANWTGQDLLVDSPSHFSESLQALLEEIDANIERELAADPRWKVFLLHRLGHNEWIPERTQSITHKINPAWLGKWVLEKGYDDWSFILSPQKGIATITQDGEFTRISIKADDDVEPLKNVVNCLLRYSGGMTYLPEISKDGVQSHSRSILGEYRAGIPQPDSVSPFNPKKRYKQVLMQCENGENASSVRARFLLLANNKLVEFGYAGNHKLAIRHYRRVN